MALKKQPKKIKSRVRELRLVPASELLANPLNFRRHPAQQVTALGGLLRDIGVASALIARELPDGRLQLIDGHARAEIAGDTPVPVQVVDLTDEEAKTVLATYDAVGDLATADAAKLDSLLAEIGDQSRSIQSLLDSLSTNATAEDEENDPVDGSDDETRFAAAGTFPEEKNVANAPVSAPGLQYLITAVLDRETWGRWQDYKKEKGLLRDAETIKFIMESLPC